MIKESWEIIWVWEGPTRLLVLHSTQFSIFICFRARVIGSAQDLSVISPLSIVELIVPPVAAAARWRTMSSTENDKN